MILQQLGWPRKAYRYHRPSQDPRDPEADADQHNYEFVRHNDGQSLYLSFPPPYDPKIEHHCEVAYPSQHGNPDSLHYRRCHRRPMPMQSYKRLLGRNCGCDLHEHTSRE